MAGNLAKDKSSPEPRNFDFLFGSLEDLCQKAGKIFLAVSGGLDSMTLMDLFSEWSQQRLPVEVLHVNYGLRGGESDGDESFVREESARRGLVCRVLKVDPGTQPDAGIQDWARQIRYNWFQSLAKPDDKVVLAHHEDDLVETILMRVVRGSGLAGLQGMSVNQGIYWRPLLSQTRSELERIARARGIPYREDSSNAKLDYSRNRIRKIVLPELEHMFPGAHENLKHLAQMGQEWSRYHTRLFAETPLPATPEAWRDMGFHPASAHILAKFEQAKWAKKVTRKWLERVYEGLSAGIVTTLQLDSRHEVKLESGRLTLRTRSGEVSARSRQFSQELSRRGPSARLSPGSAVREAELEAGSGIQDNRLIEVDAE